MMTVGHLKCLKDWVVAQVPPVIRRWLCHHLLRNDAREVLQTPLMFTVGSFGTTPTMHPEVSYVRPVRLTSGVGHGRMASGRMVERLTDMLLTLTDKV